MHRPKAIRRRLTYGVALTFGLLALGWATRQIGVTVCTSTAVSAIRDRQMDRALSSLQLAEFFDDSNAETQLLHARVARRQGRFQDVQRHLDKAKEFGAIDVDLQREPLLMLAQTGRLTESEPHFSQLLEDAGLDSPEVCEAFVNGYFVTYRFGKALNVLSAWSNAFPDDEQPFFFRGVLLEHLMRWKEAANEFEHALTLNSQRQDIRLHLAEVLKQLNEYSTAADYYELCLSADNDDPNVRANWASCLMELDRIDEAQAAFESVLTRHPEQFDALLGLGRLAFDLGEFESAQQYLTQATSQRPYVAQARMYLAQVLQRTGDAPAAKEHFDYLERHQEAQTEIGRLLDKIRSTPNDYESRCHLGELLLMYGDPIVGAQWLRSAVDLDQSSGRAHAALARHYEESDNRKLATRHKELSAEAAAQPENQ